MTQLTTISPKHLQFATIGKEVLSLIHHFQAYALAFDEGERFLIEDDDIVADIMSLLTAKNPLGFDRMARLYFNSDKSFSGIVEDFISIRLTKRYAFRTSDTTLQYRLVNVADVENFSESEAEVWDFAKTKKGAKKQAKCVKGVPCDPICLRASYVCLHDFNDAQKKILKSAQAKALRLKAKAQLKGEKFIDYDIDRSNPAAAAKLGKLFIGNYLSASQPSAREIELEKRSKEIKKAIAASKKDGKYSPKDLEAEAIAVATEYKALTKERTTRLENELFVLRKALIAHQGIPEAALDQLANRIKFDESVPATKIDKIKEDLKGFYALTGTAGHENLKTIELSNPVASSNLKEGRLNVGGYVTDDRLWNHAARHWEQGTPDLNKAATEWRNQRASSPDPVKLNSLVKNGAYGEDELALKGNYIDPYLGKVHGGKGAPTEVVAMGVERLSNAKRMAALYKKDPEFLEFLVGSVVANNNAPPLKIEPQPKKVEPKKTEPKKVEPKLVEPKKVEPKKVEPKLVEPKREEPKKTEGEISYKIDRSNHESVINLGQQFAKKYFNYTPPSQAELDLEAKKVKLSKEFSAYQKKGGGAPPQLVKEMMQTGKEANLMRADREENMRKELRKMTSAVVDKHGMSDEELDALVSKVKFENTAKPYQEKITATLRQFYSTTNGVGSETIQTIKSEAQRAYANKLAKLVDTGQFPEDSILRHEFSHHFEYNSPALFKAAQAWRDSRASGPPQKISVLTKDPSYKDDEMAVPDRFLHPYVGKIYSQGMGATEVLSMGLERFGSAFKMLEFYEKDSDHFHFTLGAILAEEK